MTNFNLIFQNKYLLESSANSLSDRLNVAAFTLFLGSIRFSILTIVIILLTIIIVKIIPPNDFVKFENQYAPEFIVNAAGYYNDVLRSEVFGLVNASTVQDVGHLVYAEFAGLLLAVLLLVQPLKKFIEKRNNRYCHALLVIIGNVIARAGTVSISIRITLIFILVSALLAIFYMFIGITAAFYASVYFGVFFAAIVVSVIVEKFNSKRVLAQRNEFNDVVEMSIKTTSICVLVSNTVSVIIMILAHFVFMESFVSGTSYTGAMVYLFVLPIIIAKVFQITLDMYSITRKYRMH